MKKCANVLCRQECRQGRISGLGCGRPVLQRHLLNNRDITTQLYGTKYPQAEILYLDQNGHREAQIPSGRVCHYDRLRQNKFLDKTESNLKKTQ